MRERRGMVLSSPEEWMRLAVRYLARWDRTAAQVEQYLKEKGASPAQAMHTIGRLSDLRYLNDRAYAERWIEGRLARQPMGRNRIKAELHAKGIADPVADRAITDVLQEVSEETLARLALKAMQRKGRQLTALQAQQLLRQRGFEEETIHRMIHSSSQIEDQRHEE
jgi:regulatory protein